MVINPRDSQYDSLIKKLLQIEQKGMGFCGEGSCLGGNYIYSATTFFIPLKNVPSSIILSDINYTNCQNLTVLNKSRYGFITRAQAINNGSAYCHFNWQIQF